jgi:hypothetical protein
MSYFDNYFINKAEIYVVYSSNFERTFEACFSNRHNLNTELNNLSAKVLLLHFVSENKMNSVVFNVCSLKMFIIDNYFEIIE